MTIYPKPTQGKYKPVKTKVKSIALFICKIIIAISIILWLVASNYNDFEKVLKDIDIVWLIGAVILYLIVMQASAFRWLLLLKLLKIKITYFEAFSLTLQGGFFSLVLPGGSLGGDLVKTGFLLSKTSKGQKLEATSTIFMDRFLGMFGQFSLGIIMGIICFPLIMEMDDLTKITTLFLLFLCILGIIAGFAILLHRQLERIKLFAWCIKLADKFTKGSVSRIAEILDTYKNSQKTLIKCILIGVIFIQVNMAFILYFIAYGIHTPYIAIKPFILAMSLGNTAGLLPITPAGIGTRDAIIKSILTAGGLHEGDAVAIPILFSALIVLFSIIGGFFFIFNKHKRKVKH
jgi:glycosyltransferase 2 family protein